MRSPLAWIAVLVLAHLLLGALRVPGSVVGRRLDEIADCRRLGHAAFALRQARLGGRAAIERLLVTTPPDAVIGYRGVQKGALEYAAGLLWPRLLRRAESLPGGDGRIADRPIADEVLVGDGVELRLEGAMIADRTYALLRGALVGLAAFALAAHALLWADAAVPPWACPLALLLGAGIGGALRDHGAAPAAAGPTTARRWLPIATIAGVGAVGVVLAYGALATPDRDWDGIVAWGLKSNALAAAPRLRQPLFLDPDMFHHSPDYPLLQPLCVAALGRVVFPLQYFALVLVVGLAVRRRTGDGAVACWSALGIALLPELIGVGGGAVDSGYADAGHALALAVAAAGLLLGDATLLAAGAVLLPFVKPEGTVHVALLVAACGVLAPVRLCAVTAVGAAVALSVWLPVQLRLAHAPPPGWLLPVALLGGALLIVAVRVAVHRCASSPRTAWLLAAVGVAAVAAGLWAATALVAGGRTVLFGHYLGDAARAFDKLPRTGEILGGLLGIALSPRRFGFLFAVLVALALARRPRATASAGAIAAAGPVPAALVAWFGLALMAVVAAFYLSPEADVAHHLRSSASRLLLQLAGVGWLLAGVALAGRLQREPLPRWLGYALGRRPA